MNEEKASKQFYIIETFIREEGKERGTVSGMMALDAVRLMRQWFTQLTDERDAAQKETASLKESRQRLAEMNLAIRRTLESAGYAPAVADAGRCVKSTSVVEMVKRLAEWGKAVECVRDELRQHLAAHKEILQEFIDYDVRDHPEHRDCAFCRQDLDHEMSEGHAADCVVTKARAAIASEIKTQGEI